VDKSITAYPAAILDKKDESIVTNPKPANWVSAVLGVWQNCLQMYPELK